MTPLAGDGDLGVRASFADIEALETNAALEDGFKIWSETPLADVCRIGIETDGGLGASIPIADFWRIGVETSFAGSRGGTRNLPLHTSLAPKDLLRSSPTQPFPIMQKQGQIYAFNR